MKKLFLLTVLLSCFSSIFALTTQGNWRWRKDNGTQITATWIAAQNTPIVLTNNTDTLRLRIELYNDPANPGGTLSDAFFEDSSNQAGARWNRIKVLPDADDAFKLAGTSPNVINLEPTTQQLTSPHSPSFAPGKVIVASDSLPASTVGDNFGTEYEYVFVPTANLKPNVTYYFRVNAANYPAGMALPNLTTSVVLPVKLIAFSARTDGKKVTLTWTTESEQNNDRFEVEKSTDGRGWRSIATVKGSGTTNQARNYTSYDDQPATGTNYYRLKQFDLDGKFSISDVRSVKFGTSQNVLVSISPNPVRDVVNFKVTGFAATNVTAVFSDANGKVIHQQKFANLQDGTLNQLNLRQKPMAGMYVLKLQAEGMSESIKVVVQ